MDERIDRDANPSERPDLWTATFLLMGLIYPESVANALLQGKHYMRESSTYQAILREGKAEGKAEEAKTILLRLGRKHLGPPAPAFESSVQAMTDVEKIENLTERLFDVSSWDELLAES
jgi:Domain of unknown function (DUF4351)